MRASNAKANFSGVLKIGDVEIPCFVLDNGKRVLSGRAIVAAIGMKGRGQGLARIQRQKGINPFISAELSVAIQSPIIFKSGGFTIYGYEATLLHTICETILQARDAGELKTQWEKRYAEYAAALIRAFAKTGIIALVDEATGYQEQREKNALEKFLSIYLTEERLKWAKCFPDSFYREVYRLNKWDWPPRTSTKRPGVIGIYTNDIVYERLPKGVLEKLQVLNPTMPDTKRRKHKHHQFFSEDIGQPDLQKHLLQVIAIMKAAPSWKSFIRLLDRAFPKGGLVQLELPEK